MSRLAKVIIAAVVVLILVEIMLVLLRAWGAWS